MDNQSKRNVFFYALLAATLTPMAVFPLVWAAEIDFNHSLPLALMIFAGGFGHVASTACIYADGSVREVIRPMSGRFYYLPIACLIATGAALVWGASLELSASVFGSLFGIHLLWLHYHYQKQNYGLVAFVAASTGSRVPPILSQLLLLPALAGVLAVMPRLVGLVVDDVSYLAAYAPGLYAAALVVYAVGAVAVGGLVLTNRKAFAHPRTIVFTAVAFSFCLPAIVLGGSDYGFWSYAVAHGFQYLLMILTVTGGAKLSVKGGAAFLVCTVAGGYFLYRLNGNQALVLSGILLTWVHFVLDAKLWRMSEPGPRKLLRDRFEFLFSQS